MSRSLSLFVSFFLGLIMNSVAVSVSAAETSSGTTPSATATAIFAGGCFWCTESDFEKLPGVIGVKSGYTGGKTVNPTYEQVSAGGTGHTEAVQVSYDPSKVSFARLVDHFWLNIDPEAKDRQFCDVGTQYRSGIYWQTDEERKIAEASRAALLASGKVKAVHTEIIAASPFYPAEEYHQDYYKKNPIRYTYYRNGCGRDERLQSLWGKK